MDVEVAAQKYVAMRHIRDRFATKKAIALRWLYTIMR
jgi:hypothetical protein